MTVLKREYLFALGAACLLGSLFFVVFGCSKKPSAKNETSIPTLPRKYYDTARLFSGLFLKSSVVCTNSPRTALATIADTNSYQLDITLHVNWPQAATNSADLSAATPELPLILPNLDQLLKGTSPSPAYAELLRHKEHSLRANLATLQRLPYRDSLFDCQTILDLYNTNSSRAALLVQAIMNVNTDGSDGDRNLQIDKLSSTFQPQTNYRWEKTGTRPNPCLKQAETQLALSQAELGNGTLTPKEKTSLENEHASAQATVIELKRWSFLVGAADPFIVLPSFMVGKSPGQPSIGDYAVVITHGTLYPAILGDLGPNSKIGEASLRICREIDSKSGADRRPSSRPEVVYLVFPGTAEKPLTTPDYNHWSQRCHALWKEFGGSDSAPWHEWSSLERPWPTPTPLPPPSPTPVSSLTLPQESPGTNSASTLASATAIPQPTTPIPSPSSSLPSASPSH
jgi:hypothetical protein